MTPPSTTRDDAVRGRAVTVAYGDHLALCEIDFVLPASGLTAVIGPNGSGKTTLLRVVSGLVEPDSGEIRFDRGKPTVAHVLQSSAVNEAVPLTVEEVVRMGRYRRRGLLRRLGAADLAAVRDAMARMEVTDLAGRHLRELSGGQRQRVYVAQGLAQDADLLLLDEPVTGLDLASQSRITEVIREELERGRTVVMTTHDVAAAATADHVLLLASEIVAAGPPEQVLTEAHLDQAFSGRAFRTPEGTLILGDPHHHGAGVPPHEPH